MGAVKRITANLPRDLVRDACRVTGRGITETIVEGLERVRRSKAAEKASRLKGRLVLDLDLDVSRERTGC